MKYIFLSVLAVMGSLFYSCKNNSGYNITENSAQPAVKQQSGPVANDAENLITFKVNDESVITSGWNISRSMMNDRIVLNVTSNMHGNKRTINININGDKKGRYRFLDTGGYNKPGFAYGSYFSDYNTEMMLPYHFEDGEFILTAIDTARGFLDAEFSGMAKNDKGEMLNITEGKVTRGKLRPGVTKY